MSIKPILFNTDMVRAILDGRKTVTRRLVKVPPYYPHFYKLHDNADGALSGNKNRLYAGFYNNEQIFYIDGEKHVDAVYYQAPYQPGDILYVRETWHKYKKRVGKGEGCHIAEFYGYRASIANSEDANEPWKPSIHMPKEAARLFLHVKDVRVERLQDITEEQAKAEGISRLYDDMSKEEYEKWARKVGQVETQEECSFKNYLWHGNFGKYGTGNRLSDAWEYQYSGYDNAVGSFSSLWNTTVDLKDWDRYGWDASPWVWVIEFERCEKPKVT